MKYLLMVMVLLTSGCSIRSAYPAIGAGLGGGLGSIGGPMSAAGGAMLGGSLGTAAMETGEHASLKAQVAALTSGDVTKLIAEDRSGFNTVIDGIYRILWLLGIGMAIWFVIPWVWAKYHVRKTVEKHINGNKK